MTETASDVQNPQENANNEQPQGEVKEAILNIAENLTPNQDNSESENKSATNDQNPSKEQHAGEMHEAAENLADKLLPKPENNETENPPENTNTDKLSEENNTLAENITDKLLPKSENNETEQPKENSEENKPSEEIHEATDSIADKLLPKSENNETENPTEEANQDKPSEDIHEAAEILTEKLLSSPEKKDESENADSKETSLSMNKEIQETIDKLQSNENENEEKPENSENIPENGEEEQKENPNDVPIVETDKPLSIFTEHPVFETETNSDSPREPPRNSSASTSPRNKNTTPRSPRPKPKYVPAPRYVPDPNFDEKTLDKYALEAAKQKAPPLEATQPTLKYAAYRVEECVNAQDYDKATIYESSIDYLHTICDRTAYEEAIEREKQENKERLEKAKSTVDELIKKWDEEMKKQAENHNKLLEALKQRNQQELDEFEQKWQNEEFLAQYNKPSARLLSMRSIEQTFAAAKLFDRAKEAKKQADELQKVETEEQRRRAMEDMKVQYDTIIAKQENALDCFSQWSEREKTNMELKREKELYGWRMLIKRMEGPAGQNSKIKPFQETQVLGSRPLKKSQTKNAPAFSIGTLTLKNIIKSPKVSSPRKK